MSPTSSKKDLHRPSAVLFDMDGVLVKSESVWFRCVEEAGRRFRGRAVTPEEFAPTFGQGTAADIECFGLACSREALDALYVEVFLQHLDQMWVNPEAIPLFEKLKQEGVLAAVVTNTVKELAVPVLRHAKLEPWTGLPLTPDSNRRAKPMPDLLFAAAAQLGVAVSACWMVGDSRFDRQAAHAAGSLFLGLGIEGDVSLSSLGALEDWLRRSGAH